MAAKHTGGKPSLVIRLPQEIIDKLKALGVARFGPRRGSRSGGASRLVRTWIYEKLGIDPPPPEWGETPSPIATYQRERRARLAKMNTVRAIRELMDPLNGSVYSASGYVLVRDGATGCIYSQDQAQKLAEEWQANLQTVPQDDDGYEHAQAYTRACGMVKPLRDEDVPEDVLEALREESGLRGGRLTFGW
jgi:hypothetical protein